MEKSILSLVYIYPVVKINSPVTGSIGVVSRPTLMSVQSVTF